MTALGQRYVSEYGWVITLPPYWEPLGSRDEPGVLTMRPPIVFGCSKDWSLSLTWMVAAGTVDEDTLQKLGTLMMSSGPVDPGEARKSVERVFPPLGEVDDAEVIELEDGSNGLELIETFRSNNQSKCGYQLIIPLTSAPGRTEALQRLSFYAPAEEFTKHFAEVRTAARSFHYVRPFGEEPEQGGE